jgi:hypothetical protein
LFSFLGDEVCAQCFTRNFHQHASGLFSITSNLYVSSSSFFQSFVSLRRIEKYLNGAEIIAVPLLDQQQSKKTVAFQSCTLTWPQDRNASSLAPSAASTPKHKFVLVDLSLNFPQGELSLICGKLGSGKTLLLLGKPFSLFRSSYSNPRFIYLTALLGEADVLAGQVICPRSPPDSLAAFSSGRVCKEDWVVPGVCAYVPQVFVLSGSIDLVTLIIYSRLRGFGTHQSKVVSSFLPQIHGN